MGMLQNMGTTAGGSTPPPQMGPPKPTKGAGKPGGPPQLGGPGGYFKGPQMNVQPFNPMQPPMGNTPVNPNNLFAMQQMMTNQGFGTGIQRMTPDQLSLIANGPSAPPGNQGPPGGGRGYPPGDGRGGGGGYGGGRYGSGGWRPHSNNGLFDYLNQARTMPVQMPPTGSPF